jgi:PEP-CTERM motif
MKRFLPGLGINDKMATSPALSSRRILKSPGLVMVLTVALSLTLASSAANAVVIGFLGNFDVINDTGQTAYGFEIDLEGLHSSDITDVFGGPGRGFPTGRGYDPATSVERYGAPTITEYSNGAIFGTKVTYSALYDGTNWDYGTPSGNIVTPGDNCWSGGGIGYGPSTSCDHFGVGTIGNPTKTTYSWLLEASPGVLTTANGIVQLPAPVWNVNLPDPNLPPVQVVAVVEAPEPPAGFEFGDALWVKVFTTEFEDPTELEDLVGDNDHVQQAETETEWQLLQKDFNNPDSGKLESGYGAPVGPNAASILRRYEFYEFSGMYDPETHEALFEPPYGDSNPGPNDVGAYLGSQNAAVNIIIPEPQTCALLLAGLGLMGAVARRRRAGDSAEC